jgi:hypothetical protein
LYLCSYSTAASEEQEQEEAGLPENSQQNLDILFADLIKPWGRQKLQNKTTHFITITKTKFTSQIPRLPIRKAILLGVTAASVHVWGSGTLTGNGTVTTTNGTTIDGTLAPTGTLTINGDLTFGTLGTMQCNVSPSSWDRAEVSGRAALGGRVSVTMTGTFTPPANFPLLHASTLVGAFRSVSITYSNDCLVPSIVYDYDNGYVYLHVESTCQ